ncbi:MAG: M20/M25/M40 family metallo-hydrolase [Candidatus Nanopelagicales bacterium]
MTPAETSMAEHDVDPAQDVVAILRALIRIDTSNDGTDSGPGEILAAEYVVQLLREVGYDPELITTTSSRRAAVALRIPGVDPERPALLVHGHLDVVPAIAADWSVPPFTAEVVEDMVWGRGAVDMKDTDAMFLAIFRHWARTGYRPPRDIIVVFTPDEEAGGRHGAQWLVRHRPDIFAGATEAIGEVGGFSWTINDDVRVYLIQTAEKGIAWMKATARGRAGHGSMFNADNAVTELAEAISRVGTHDFPVSVGPSAQRLLSELQEVTGLNLSTGDIVETLNQLGPLANFVGSGLKNTANPSMLSAGYKVNVIPETAVAHIDGRFLPGQRDEFVAAIERLLGPKIDLEILIEDIGLEVPFEGDTVGSMVAALRAEDPLALPLPFMMAGGTDAKAFSRLGIEGYGFAPLRLPPDLNFAALFHGIDERVPIESLQFGLRVLERFFRSC